MIPIIKIREACTPSDILGQRISTSKPIAWRKKSKTISDMNALPGIEDFKESAIHIGEEKPLNRM
jgi:hypothetical protein